MLKMPYLGCFQLFQDRRDPLVKDQCQHIHDDRLDCIERHDTTENKTEFVLYDRKDRATHGYDGLKGNVVHLHISRNDEKVVSGACRNDHRDRCDHHCLDRTSFALFMAVYHGGRYTIDRRKTESSEFSDKSRRSWLEQKFDQDLDDLYKQSRNGTHGECADQTGKIGQIELIESRSDRDREVEQHQYCS